MPRPTWSFATAYPWHTLSARSSLGIISGSQTGLCTTQRTITSSFGGIPGISTMIRQVPRSIVTWHGANKRCLQITPQDLLSQTGSPSTYQHNALKDEHVEPIWQSISRAASADNLASYRPMKAKTPISSKQRGDPPAQSRIPAKASSEVRKLFAVHVTSY